MNCCSSLRHKFSFPCMEKSQGGEGREWARGSPCFSYSLFAAVSGEMALKLALLGHSPATFPPEAYLAVPGLHLKPVGIMFMECNLRETLPFSCTRPPVSILG